MRAVYLTSVEAGSGKSIVALGLMEHLSRSVSRIGFFRPVVKAGEEKDSQIELMRSRYQLSQTYEESHGVTTDETRSVGDHVAPDVVARIIDGFEALASRCDLVLIEGTDYTGASKAFEFDLNAEIASHLGATAFLVVNASKRRADRVFGAVSAAAEALTERGVPVLGVFVNRVDESTASSLNAMSSGFGSPLWYLPDSPALARPTFREVVRATRATLLAGAEDGLTREIGAVKVAAMSIPRLIDNLSSDCLLVTPSDRADVLTMALASRYSESVPVVSGVLLTGGLQPDASVLSFARGMNAVSLPILLTEMDTFETAAAISHMSNEIVAGDERKIAAALTLFEDHADVESVSGQISGARSETITPLMFEHRLVSTARSDRKHIVLPEGEDDRILIAADLLLRRDVVALTILGKPDAIAERARHLGLNLSAARVIDPAEDPLREAFARDFYELRKSKGLTQESAFDIMADVSYFGTMLVWKGMVDGMVSGAAHTTAHTIRPALQIIKTVPGVSIVSSVFLMALADRVLVYGDCAVNPNPNAEQLADIALSSAQTAKAFGIEPYVAMLSYSTGSSGTGADVDKVRQATALVKERAPELAVDGPLQYDAAVDESVAASKLPGSPVAGHATVFVFPDLNTGNNTYKAVQRSADAIAIGPILQGLRLPVNDLSRGALVEDIVNTVVITAIQAQQVAPASDSSSAG